jgi:hypothetical protein
MTAEAPKPQPPDLQEWIQRFGGYWAISWDEWDRANADYQAARRETTPYLVPPRHRSRICVRPSRTKQTEQRMKSHEQAS